MTPPAVADLRYRLAAGDISLEEFLWAAPGASLDRRSAALHAVAVQSTATPGSRTTRGADGADGADGGNGAEGLAGARPDDARPLRIGLWLPVDGLDPAVATYRTSRLVTEQLYSTLMALGPDGRPYPDLAAWVEVSDDALTYTFGLVEGVRFHDGTPLTADDVAFTFRRLLDLGEAYHFDPWVATIAGVDAIDPLTVRIRLSQPTGPILTWLAFCGTGIVPKAAVEAGRDLTHEPIGSGPFKVAEPWSGPDKPVRLVAHDASAHGGALFRPPLGGLEFHSIPSGEARATALTSGEIDLDALLDPAFAARVAGTSGLAVHETPDSRWHWLVVNCRHAPLGDLRVRQAIAHAIDRRELLHEGFADHGTTITAGVIAPWSFASAPDLAGFAETADVPQARALLAAANVGPDSRLRIAASAGLPIAIRQAELIAAQLRNAGLDVVVELEPADASTMVTHGGNFDLSTSYWGSPIWDPDDFVWMGFRSGARYDVGACSTPVLDAEMDRGRGTVVQRDRRAAYRRLQELAVEQLPVIPTIQPAMLRGATSRLAGYVPTPNAQLRTLRDAWLSPEAAS